MPSKAPAINMENAIAAYVAGEAAQSMAPRFGVCAKRLTAELKARGLFRPLAERRKSAHVKLGRLSHDRLNLPDAEIAERYAQGVSENRLAIEYGVARGAISTSLKRMGIPRRGLNKSQALMVASRPIRERQVLYRIREGDRQVPIETSITIARAHQDAAASGSKMRMSKAEIALRKMLVGMGEPPIPQQAIGPYNTDIGLAPIAVEVWGGDWHFYTDHTERLRYILDAGWHLVIIYTNPSRNIILTPGAAEYIVAFHKEASGNPTAPREYRVVRGNGELFAIGDRENDKLTHIVPSRTGMWTGA